MSKMIPQESIDAFRQQVDVTLSMYGIDCVLYLPTDVSYAASEKKDVFAIPADLTFISYAAQVFIEWGVSVYRLKQLGLFVEDMLPIVAWFPNHAIAREGSEIGTEVAIDVIKRSYFTVSPEFIPGNYVGSEAFEVVNPTVKGIHDAVLVQGWSIVPRRIRK
jgi:hypothetical protein